MNFVSLTDSIVVCRKPQASTATEIQTLVGSTWQHDANDTVKGIAS